MSTHAIPGELGTSPFISAEELERARRRIGQPQWQGAAEHLRRRADDVIADKQPLPTFDSSWYDACPERSYAETYTQWHSYILPATRLGHRIRAMVRAGLVFGDQECFKRARGWLVHLAGALKFHVRHHDSAMEYGRCGDPMAEAYAVLRGRMTGDEREIVQRALTECGAAIWEGTRHWLANLAHMPYNNHFAAHRRSLLCIGLVLGRQDWIDDALEGPRNFGELLVGATLDDGLCYESSTLYHYATLGGLMQIAELVRHAPHLGRDLYREVFANGRNLKQMLDAPLGLLLPTGELPALGDCYAHRQPLWCRAASTYELAYAVYGDPRYAWLIQRAEQRVSETALLFGVDELGEAQSPEIRSRVWVEHGYALVTAGEADDYWEGKGTVAVLTGDRSGVHNHRDTLSLQVALGGRLWTDDAESAAVEAHGFSAPIQRAFNRTALAHNLVMVDGEDQNRTDRTLPIVAFQETPSCVSTSMVDREGMLAEGVQMMRTVAVTAGYCLDVFQVSSEQEHQYNWLLHPRSDQHIEWPVTTSPVQLPDAAPYSALREAAGASVPDGSLGLSWEQQGRRAMLHLMAMDAENRGLPAELICAQWPTRSDWSEGGREMFALRVHASRAVFVALYRLADPTGQWRVSSARRMFNGQSDELRIDVSCEEETRSHVLEAL